MGLLRTEGPLTATRAGELLGESSGTCSFHLRPPGARQVSWLSIAFPNDFRAGRPPA